MIWFLFSMYWCGFVTAAPFETHQAQLQNGLEVLLQPVQNTGEIVLQMQYNIGAGDLKESGLPHLVEHLMFEGSKHVANGDYDRLLQLSGGSSSAWTTHEQIVFSARFPSEALDLVLFLESDRMGWLCDGISPEDIENQSLVVLQEYLSDSSTSDGTHDEILRLLVFGETHPRGKSLDGDPFLLDTITHHQVCQFAQQWLQPSNAQLILVGEFTVENASERITHWFSDVAGKPVPEKQKNGKIPRVSQQNYSVPSSLSRLYASWPTVPFGHEDEAPLSLLFDMLVHTTEGRLNNDGVTAFGWVENDRFGGMFTVYLEGKSQLELKQWLWQALSFKCLRESHLRPFKQRTEGAYVRALHSSFVRAKSLGKCATVGRGKDCFYWDITRRVEVTPADIIRVKNRYLHPDKAVYLSATPDVDRALPNAKKVEW